MNALGYFSCGVLAGWVSLAVFAIVASPWRLRKLRERRGGGQ